MARSFAYTNTGEPHARRRAEILAEIPEIRRLYGHDPRTAIVTTLVIAAQLLLAGWLARQARAQAWVGSWWAITAMAYFVGAILAHWLAMAVHETSHFLALRTPWQNRLLALAANVPVIVPMAMTFHRYHLAHHTYLGVDSLDTDLPHAWEVRNIGNSRPRKFVWLFFYLFTYTARGATFAGAPNRLELLNVATQAAATWAIWHSLGGVAVGYLLLSLFFGMSLHPVAAHFIHEHYVFSEGQETYSYYGPLNRVTFNVGYHVEHHDFMQVPGWRLPELRALARKHYAGLASHRSWTYVLWHFIMSPGISLGNRIVRTRGDFDRGRRELRERRPRRARRQGGASGPGGHAAESRAPG